MQRTLRNVTLEMSLKPFKRLEPDYIDSVCRRVFHQWIHLLDRSDMVSVLLWTADGSEILDYRGNRDDELEWARYLGTANSRAPKDLENDPELRGLHSRPYLYRDDPPTMTYATLAHIVARLRSVGEQYTGKPVRVGATFDPGPEFAKSPFKYDRHIEICSGGYHGVMSFAYCYATLHADDVPYAGFPKGIPEGTSLGTFLGRQSRHFLDDMGFDYLWLSNGFGFGTENWGTTGVLFDGQRFDDSRYAEVRDKVLGFWRAFRAECPRYPIETRGTNLSTGIDLASDAVPLGDIYRGGFEMLGPPNSPWAALNGDFGLELIGYMSRMAELPGAAYPFRFYVHDPWWMNSPWLDRYGREPHDIYLPLACSRVDAAGAVVGPSDIQFLTIDDSLGNMPDRCPNEVVPHILAGLDDGPDEVPPFLWAYPFDDYHRRMEEGGRGSEVFSGDWFVRAAINDGFPLTGVVSTTNFAAVSRRDPQRFDQSIVVTPTPDEGSEAESAILDTLDRGGRVILYGPIRRAGKRLLDLLGLRVGDAVSGEGEVAMPSTLDSVRDGATGGTVIHRALVSGGPVCAEPSARGGPDHLLVNASFGGRHRALAVVRRFESVGGLGWVRGTVSADYREGEYLLVPDDAGDCFRAEWLARFVASQMGYSIRFSKIDPNDRSPVVTAHRHNGGLRVAMYAPVTLVGVALRFPLGAPLLEGIDTELAEGSSTYHPPRFWTRECRLFVDGQTDGVIHTRRMRPAAYRVTGRMVVSGLEHATVRFLPERGFEESTSVLLNSEYPWMVGEPFELRTVRDARHGVYLEAADVTGELMFAW